jgi:2-haloacid dehalogenase
MAQASASRPQTVVFDLGGVLIDWNPRHLYRKLFPDDEAGMEAFLTSVCTPAWNEQQDAGRRTAAAESELIDRFPDKTALIRAYYGRFGEMLSGPIAGTVDVLKALHEAGVPLYALSNWSAETFPIARERFAFLGRFRNIVVSGEAGIKKPDAAIFHLLLSRNGLTAGDCVFIDDSAANIAAASALGFMAVRFHSPEQLTHELRGLGFLGAHVKNNLRR